MSEILSALGVAAGGLLLVLGLPAWLFMVGVSWVHGKKWPTGRPIRKRKTRAPK